MVSIKTIKTIKRGVFKDTRFGNTLVNTPKFEILSVSFSSDVGIFAVRKTLRVDKFSRIVRNKSACVGSSLSASVVNQPRLGFRKILELGILSSAPLVKQYQSTSRITPQKIFL